ncbi:MAG: ABC transporter permease [Acholeplasmataceae bacterium]
MSIMRLLRKELFEIVKTHKLVIIASVFIFFAILGPLTAKYMNEIFQLFAQDLEFTFPDPTYRQSWEQFYSNMTSISMIVYLILMSGVVSSEKSKGSLYLVLTKNVTRTSFILAKMIAGMILFTGIFLISIGITLYYTHVLFDAVIYDGLWLSLVSIWALGLFYTMLAIVFSILVKQTTHAALISFAMYALLNILTIIPDLNRFNPAGSVSLSLAQLSSQLQIQNLTINIIVTIFVSVVLACVGIRVFNKQEL